MKASDNAFPSLLLANQAAAPATPASGQARLYRSTDGKLWIVDSTGLATPVGSGSGAYTSYTPVLTAATTNPSLGTGGKQLGRYWLDGDTVHFQAHIGFGTGATAGQGSYFISLPVAGHADQQSDEMPVGYALTWNGSNNATGVCNFNAGGDTSKVALHTPNGVTHSYPQAWASGMHIWIGGTYRKA